jgi:putative intracellular protease/amidase
VFKVAALVADGFQRDQVLDVQEFLRRAGATVTLVSAGAKDLPETGNAGGPLGSVPLESADEASFDALLLPDGQASADNLSRNPVASSLPALSSPPRSQLARWVRGQTPTGLFFSYMVSPFLATDLTE